MPDYSTPRSECPPVGVPHAIGPIVAQIPQQTATTAAPAFEPAFLCDPVSGAQVLVVTSLSSAGVPSAVAYAFPAMTTYPGSLSALVDCPDADLESDPMAMCDNGTTAFTRWIVKKNGAPTGAFFDTTATGSVYVPVGAVVAGACVAPVASIANRIYSQELLAGQTRTMAQILAATGASRILSVEVKQFSGAGSYTGDTGGPVLLSAGASQSWSVGDNTNESLNASALSISSGTGVQHLSAIYV